MKTFSNMSTPDQILTKVTYQSAVTAAMVERDSLPRDNDYQAKFLELSKKIERLIRLIDALDTEIKAAAVS